MSTFKAYIGNLSPAVTEERLHCICRDNGISVNNITLKNKYAFIDFPDQVNTDLAIDMLNGMNLDGMVLQVEPPLSKRGKTNKIVMRNMPVHIANDEVELLARSCGNIIKCDHVGAEGIVYVTYENAEQAQQAVSQLNNQTWNGVKLQVEYATTRPPRITRTTNNPQQKVPDIPVRILLRSEYVGAVIGREGVRIQQITKDSGAKIDVHRREHPSTQETTITIKGHPHCITEAVKKIMEVAKEEADSGSSKGDIPLKILCPNYLCGRIIGRQGRVINNIMDSSSAHIVVSSSPDSNNYYVERVITVSGDVENMSRAEALVSERMRKAYQNDTERAQNFGMVIPNLASQFAGLNTGFPPSMNQSGYPPCVGAGPGWGFNGPSYCHPVITPEPVEETYMYFPEMAVGTMIGTSGSNIKSMMETSGAKMKVLSEEDSHPMKTSGNGDNGDRKEDKRFSTAGLRKMRILGTHEAQWKAQFQVFKKLSEENFICNHDSLVTEILIPLDVTGRVIGKGGKNLQEMHRVCGGTVHVCDTINENQVPIRILGNFYVTQAIQLRIRVLVNNSSQPQPNMPQARLVNSAPQMNGTMNPQFRERRPRREQPVH